MFLKRTKRKIKQLLFTGYLNTTVKHFDVMPIYHSQLFNLFTLPVSLLPHLRDFLFESWSLFQYRALRAVVSPGRTRLAKPLLAGYKYRSLKEVIVLLTGKGIPKCLEFLEKKGFWKKKKRVQHKCSYDENKNLEFILKTPIFPGCALEIVPFLSAVPCGRTQAIPPLRYILFPSPVCGRFCFVLLCLCYGFHLVEQIHQTAK